MAFVTTGNVHELSATINTMADEVIDLLEPQVREMLRILNISDKDAEMRKLILRLGETSRYLQIQLFERGLKLLTFKSIILKRMEGQA